MRGVRAVKVGLPWVAGRRTAGGRIAPLRGTAHEAPPQHPPRPPPSPPPPPALATHPSSRRHVRPRRRRRPPSDRARALPNIHRSSHGTRSASTTHPPPTSPAPPP